MKVKTISRIENDYTKELKSDRAKVQRNYDPELHPFERAREYTRTLNAVKLDKIFAKPFVGALDGHCDSVSCLATSSRNLVALFSGSCDGEIRVWDLPHRKSVWSCYGHSGFVRGIAVTQEGTRFFSCSEDKSVKCWKLNISESNDDETPEPLISYHGKEPFMGIDHHWSNKIFATCGFKVSVWNHNRSEPIHQFSWGADSITSVKFNPSEASLLASTGADRSICLYDIRISQPMRKLVMTMRSNALAWNPMEPYHFTVANEDHNLYSYDMRNLERAIKVHKDHVSAVMDVSYSPTGKEFVSGSYDRTIRIFTVDSSKSREVYHTKRMQRVFAVKFSADAKFILSGSDDTNIRMWKANASSNLRTMNPREQKKLDYYTSLKQRYKHLQEIKRISKHRHVPKAIKKATIAKQDENSRRNQKFENQKKHSKAGALHKVCEKRKSIVQEME